MEKDTSCAYCMEGELVAKFGIKICEMDTCKVYLFKEQSHPGRVILAHKKHVGDMTELTAQERAAYFEDIAKVSAVLHFHLVPKYKDEFEWGGVFLMNPDKKYLTEAEYADMVEKIRAGIEA